MNPLEEIKIYRRKIKRARTTSWSLAVACRPSRNGTSFLIPTLFPEDCVEIQAEFLRQGAIDGHRFMDPSPCLDYFENFLDLVQLYVEESE